MELRNIVQFLENKTILVTGATGFLAKIFVEKILRAQPNVKKLFLLLRATTAKSAAQRLQNEITGKEAFRVLREIWGPNFNSFISEKVIPVAGDISCSENLGVKDTNIIEDMCRKIDIVVNSAATTSFDERYDMAFGINALGAQHVMDFAKKCTNLKLLLHVSTAYVSREKEGIILEKPLYMGETLNGVTGLDIDEEKKLVEEKLKDLRSKGTSDEAITVAMQDFGIQRATRYGWPNTYAFTKSMGEMLLEHFREDLPLVILRPTIITCTYKEPFPGWVEGFRTADTLIISYGKGKLTSFLGDVESIIDMIPADMVVNVMIAAMAAHASQPLSMIYHVGSSVRNPFKAGWFYDFSYTYFTQNPLTNKNGNPIKVGKVRVMASVYSYYTYLAFRVLVPLKGLQLLNIISGQHFRDKYVQQNRKINFLMRLTELYKPYLFFKAVFNDMNTVKLKLAVMEGGAEADVFYFDPNTINWEDYFIRTHIPGVVKYVLK